MVLSWDWGGTKVYKEREGRFKDLWEWLTKSRGGKRTKTKLGVMVEMSYDFYTLIPMWLYGKAGGRYGERGKEWLEGKYYKMTKELAGQMCDELYTKPITGKLRTALIEGVQGLKVSATPFPMSAYEKSKH